MLSIPRASTLMMLSKNTVHCERCFFDNFAKVLAWWHHPHCAVMQPLNTSVTPGFHAIVRRFRNRLGKHTVKTTGKKAKEYIHGPSGKFGLFQQLRKTKKDIHQNIRFAILHRLGLGLQWSERPLWRISSVANLEKWMQDLSNFSGTGASTCNTAWIYCIKGIV